MSDRYAVIGNPVAHSKSPAIHAAFARATGEDLAYGRIEAPRDGFREAVARFAAEGGCGLNVTVPFKLEAFALSHEVSERARAAGAVNTLKRDGQRWYGDNTDGAGILRDLNANLGVAIEGRDVLVLGAGGAARGVMLPLSAARPRTLCVANRTPARAGALAQDLASRIRGTPLETVPVDALGRRTFDVVISATSAGLGGESALPWPAALFAPGAFAYDMVYGDAPTLFLRFAREAGVTRMADGLGMLVEQAAESFALWRGLRPATEGVRQALRAGTL